MATDPLDPLIAASEGGTIFHVVGLPVPGGVVALHLLATEDGFAFVDPNWTQAQATSHVGHRVKGKVVSPAAAIEPDQATVFQTDEGEYLTIWPLATEDDTSKRWRDFLSERGRTHAEDRALAVDYMADQLAA